MKKLILGIVLTAVSFVVASAQEYKNAWGISVGYENSINQTNYTTYRYFRAYNIGASYKTYLWEGLNLNPEIRFQMNDNYGAYRVRKFAPELGHCNYRWDLRFQLRPTVGYRYKFIEVYTGPRLDIIMCHDHSDFQVGDGATNDHLHRAEVYWNVGLAGHYRNFSLGASFNQPLLPCYGPSSKHEGHAARTIDVTLTYRFVK